MRNLVFGFTLCLVFFIFTAACFSSAEIPLSRADGFPALVLAEKSAVLYAQEDGEDRGTGSDEEEDLDYLEEDIEPLDRIADPLEPVNRGIFYFNDKLYFWFLKPVSQGYAAVLPKGVRISVKNFFNNLSTPVRAVNSLLQMKVKHAGNELLRFGINSTWGMLGFYDVAKGEMNLEMQDEDLGQTLGVWGLGPGIYLNWPFLGPSSVRDTFGAAGDYFLDPVNYVTPSLDRTAIKAGDRINRTSLSIGDYEEIKKDAFDPYDAVKDIYYQYRKNKIAH